MQQEPNAKAKLMSINSCKLDQNLENDNGIKEIQITLISNQKVVIERINGYPIKSEIGQHEIIFYSISKKIAKQGD